MVDKGSRNICIPEYMQNFKCIGSNCEDCCCIGWNLISVDKLTYKKYKNCSNIKYKKLLQGNVLRIRKDSSDRNYAKIKLKEDISCPFLTDKNLCGLQSDLGEKYLSDTCSTYPRVTNIVNGIREKSLYMSCPEAVRVALLNPDGIAFIEVEESNDIKNLIYYNIDTSVIVWNDRFQEYFWEIRIFTFQILKSRDYELWERLIILGMFYNKMQEYSEKNIVNQIPNLINEYTSLVINGEFKDILQNVPNNNNLQMLLLKQLIDVRGFNVSSKRYKECITEFLIGIDYTQDNTIDEIFLKYNDAYNQYYKLFMDEHEYIMENYLVNTAFLTLFPLGNYDNTFYNYYMLILQYSLIKMLLIGLSGYHKENFNTDIVVKLIQSFSKIIEHDRQFIDKIYNLLKNNNYLSLAYMSVLVKN